MGARMADRRDRQPPGDEEVEANDSAAEEGAGDRRRRSEMTRRELRRRTRRAKRAARDGDSEPVPRRRRSDAPPRDDIDREVGLEADRREPAIEPRPIGGEVGDSDEDAVDLARPRGRRRRGKRRDRERARVQDLDPLGGDEGRDRISGEVLFGEPSRPDGEAVGDDAEVAGDRDAGGDDAEVAGDRDAADDVEVTGEGDGDAGGDDAEAVVEAMSDDEPELADEDGGAPEDEPDVAADGDVGEPTRTTPRPSPPPPASRGTSRLVAAVLALVALLVFGLVAMQLGWIDLARDIVGPAAEDEVVPEPPADGWQPAFLLASVDDDVPGGELRSLAVLATDRRDERGTVLLVPTTVVADVPGFGSFTLREAWELGGSSLVAVTVDNLLGLHIDGVLAVDRSGWASWFEPIDGADLTIRARIVPRDGHAGQAIEPGTRNASPEEVASYALIHGQGETELDVLPRTRQVLDALFEAIGDDPSVLDAVVDAARTFPGTATPDRIRTVLGELADHRDRDELTSVSLPVVPLGSGDDDLYRSDEERLSSVIDDRFAASRDDRAITDRLALQILNGNGRPGVGQEVAERLADGSYRIVLTGNADRFTYDSTRIVVYSDDVEVLRAAQDIQERLGDIGSIERAGTPQSVVDMTIVVGHDFPP